MGWKRCLLTVAMCIATVGCQTGGSRVINDPNPLLGLLPIGDTVLPRPASSWETSPFVKSLDSSYNEDEDFHYIRVPAQQGFKNWESAFGVFATKKPESFQNFVMQRIEVSLSRCADGLSLVSRIKQPAANPFYLVSCGELGPAEATKVGSEKKSEHSLYRWMSGDGMFFEVASRWRGPAYDTRVNNELKHLPKQEVNLMMQRFRQAFPGGS